MAESKRNRLTAKKKKKTKKSSSSSSTTPYCLYNFSEVKLPDWMCISNEISFDKLTEKQKCYVNFYSKNSTTKAAKQNS